MHNLTVTLLCTNAGGYTVGRFDLAIPGEEDETWSIVLHRTDWATFLWTLTHAPREFMAVKIKGEELLNGH